jgi:molybdopterin converting factor small subunit
VALNEEFLPGTGAQVLSWSGFIRDGDVVAFIPPVTGG